LTPLRFNPTPRWRKSQAASRERGKTRPIVVAMEPASLLLRLKGTRAVLRLPIGTAYQMAAQLEANRLKRVRAEARKAKKAGSGK